MKYSLGVDFRNFRWKVPYNSKLNGKLMEVALLANIDKKLFMHLGRHSFATTITLSNGISLETANEVSKIMGIYQNV